MGADQIDSGANGNTQIDLHPEVDEPASPINTLPPEILLDILRLTLSCEEGSHFVRHDYYSSITKAKLVSRAWANLIDNCPLFWAVIFPNRQRELQHLALQRSGNALLSVRNLLPAPSLNYDHELFWPRRYNYDYELVGPHLYRCRSLDLMLANTRPFLNLLDCEAPNLKILCLRNWVEQLSILNLFRCSFQLKTLTIIAVHRIEVAPWMSGLQTLVLRNFQSSLRVILGILALSPTLTALEITTVEFSDVQRESPDGPPLYLPLREISLPNLGKVKLRLSAASLHGVLFHIKTLGYRHLLLDMLAPQHPSANCWDHIAHLFESMRCASLLYTSQGRVELENLGFSWHAPDFQFCCRHEEGYQAVRPLIPKISKSLAQITELKIMSCGLRSDQPMIYMEEARHFLPNLTHLTLPPYWTHFEPLQHEYAETSIIEEAVHPWLLPSLTNITLRIEKDRLAVLRELNKIVSARRKASRGGQAAAITSLNVIGKLIKTKKEGTEIRKLERAVPKTVFKYLEPTRTPTPCADDTCEECLRGNWNRDEWEG